METIGIEEGVTTLGAYLFLQCVKIQEIFIPNSVHTIGSNAFYHCKGLQTVRFGKNLQNFGESNPFLACWALKKLIIDEDNKYIKSVNNTLYVPATKTLI